ncbi:conserved hypothetical protein [Pediculus humanus corporis]|uniref:Cytochrome c oxidase assembly protein COX20, mitochondrial n=1 Tax=Pediculus humanus subsp. corporis TaxID=121224 RepID=E0VP04_PEDHC|nr:uncharacterized protein Phum_PHUM348610 [Pediculus humanus corporis]EEB15110.1 conserved hypothetical protein [Pediculus humanus corporis]
MNENLEESTIESKHKPIMFMGRDVTQIPCFRKSLIFGICGGITIGLGTFLYTSKPAFSSHVCFGSIWACVFLYW